MHEFRSAGGLVLAGVLLASAALLSACSADAPQGESSGSATASASPSAASPSTSATAAPSPVLSGTETLTPEQLQAFEEATQTVLAYRQTIVDLYSGARENLNDLYLVATGELVDQNLRNVQQGLVQGRRIEPEGVQIRLVTASPRSVDLDADPPKVVVRACVNSTEATAVAPDGTETAGKSELSDYTLVKAAGLPEPGWAVTRIQADPDEADRAC